MLVPCVENLDSFFDARESSFHGYRTWRTTCQSAGQSVVKNDPSTIAKVIMYLVASKRSACISGQSLSYVTAKDPSYALSLLLLANYRVPVEVFGQWFKFVDQQVNLKYYTTLLFAGAFQIAAE